MKMNDEELIAAIEGEEALCVDANTGKLAGERAEALARYRGEPLGNEQEGRSQIVSKDILDTIEWIMPSLIRIYMGGDEIGKFTAISQRDEQAADIETEVCNWNLLEKNDAFSQISAVLKDALLLKNGYTVAYWNKRDDTSTSLYEGLTDEEAGMLAQDEEIEVVEHSEYPDPAAPQQPDMQLMPGMQPMPQPMLHDIKIERKRADEYVAVECIPPDEVKVSRRHRWTSLMDADFVQWNRHITIGQARAEGFKISDDTPAYGSDDFTMEWTQRERYQDLGQMEDGTNDPTRRMILLKDTYIRIDLRGKGTPQLWRVVHVWGSKQVVLKEEADIIPIAAFSPIIYPHSHTGMSVFDLIQDLGEIKTTVQRMYLDGLYLATSGQFAVDVNRVNVDDWLVSRPGGLKRIEGPVEGAFAPIPVNDVGQIALGGLEYLDTVKESRTGVTRYSAGLDANSLNKTATGVQAIQGAANQRIELIARTLAGGFKDLFLIMHALICKHSTKPLQIKLKGQWQAIDPRSWQKRTDFQISVGLGTGSPDQQMQKLQMIMQFQAQGAALGLVGPEEFYNAGVEFLKAAGYKNPDKFLQEPKKDAQGNAIAPPPQPNPLVQAEQIKQQGAQQLAAQKHQAEGQKVQAEVQAMAQVKALELEKEGQLASAEHAFELQKLEMQLASNERIAAMNNAVKTDLELAKMAEERALQIHVQDRELQAKDKELGVKTDLEQQKLKQTGDTEKTRMAHERHLAGAGPAPAADGSDPVSTLTQHIGKLVEHMSKPKRIVRDTTGRATGIQ